MDLYDSHMHTKNSADSREDLAEIVRRAKELGLAGIAVTDHCEVQSGREYVMEVLDGLAADIAAVRDSAKKDPLRVSFGCELGQIDQDPELASEVAAYPGIDFVLGSFHKLRGETDFYFIDYESRDVDEIISRYYAELLESARVGGFDSMAHINYIKRYMSEKVRGEVDFSSHYDELREVLKVLADSGIGIEMNTSSGKGFADLVPELEVWRMWREVGGEVITIGSDAHRAVHVGGRIAEAHDVLKSVGFTRAAFFEQRRAIFYEL